MKTVILGLTLLSGLGFSKTGTEFETVINYFENYKPGTRPDLDFKVVLQKYFNYATRTGYSEYFIPLQLIRHKNYYGFVFHIDCGFGGYCAYRYLATTTIDGSFIDLAGLGAKLSSMGEEVESEYRILDNFIEVFTMSVGYDDPEDESTAHRSQRYTHYYISDMGAISEVYQSKRYYKQKYKMPSDRLLIDDDFIGLSADELAYIRNEIYASYGYIFKTDRWRSIFSKCDWYKPKYANIDDLMSRLDKVNISLILEKEKKLEKAGE